jgi:ABC-type sugar transport system substrate-binding protein
MGIHATARHRALVATIVLATTCLSIAATGASASNARSPDVHKFSWGTFHLSPRIASKLKSNSSINVVLSYIAQSTPVYSPEFKYGFAQGVKSASRQYGLQLKGHLIGPVTANTNEQINQIRSQIATNSVDCLVVESGGVPALAPVINQAVKAGIPAFTTNTDVAASRRFGTFHTNWKQEGRLAADAVIASFKARKVALKEAMLTTGAVDQNWAQDRMQSFAAELKKRVPGIKLANTPKGALNTGFDAGQVYSQVRAFLQGHPDVQVVYQTDVNAVAIDKAIGDLKKKGSIFTAGHNVSNETLDAIAQGTQIVTIDQQFPLQAGWAARACAAYLKTGKILPNDNPPGVITKSNIAAARAAFKKATGGK